MFAGVTSISVRAAGELGADNVDTGGLGAEREVVATVGPADRVVVLGDLNLFENTYLPEADNAAFAASLFTWLHEPPPSRTRPGEQSRRHWSARR